MTQDAWRYVTDGGLETDLISHHGVELPEFAAYPLVWSDEGRATLRSYYEQYAEVAMRAGAGLLLETPTWRANPDWGAKLGHDAAALDDANRTAVTLLAELADTWRGLVPDIVVSGLIGPRGDGYRPGARVDPDEAADYHLPQLGSLAEAGAQVASVLTLTDPGEAIGVARAAASVGLPLRVSFTVETDGRLPDGTPLREAVEEVDATAPPAYFLMNCAHPTHLLPAFAEPGAWVERIRGLRTNASTQTHAELDAAEVLDEGDVALLVSSHRELERLLPTLDVVGGCCGTDVRHVAALWGVEPPGQRSGTNR